MVVHLVVPAGPPMSEGPSRAGFVVSGSVGGSVVRHRVIRRLRASIRPRLDELPAGSQVVVRALPGSADASFDQLCVDLTSALGRALAKAPGRALKPVRPEAR